MKHLGILVLVSSATILCFGEQTKSQRNEKIMARIAMSRYGGKIRQPNSEKGLITFVNRQNLVDVKILERVVEKLGRQFKFTTKITSEEATSAIDHFVIRIEELDREETILLAPENFWVSVNVKKLMKDSPPSVILVNRFEKEVRRAFAFVCGGTCGTETGGLCRMISKSSDLDAISGLDYSLDVEARIVNNMKESKVKPYRIAKYSEACQEGWAPPPTNEFQKAIWDKVHAVPASPMKIEFDPKKGR